MSTVIKKQSWNSYRQCQAQYYTPQMQALLNDIESAFKHPIRVLKNDPTSTVVVVNVDSQPLVIKRANTKHWSQAFRRMFSRSRAKKNWLNAQKLLAIGISTFMPIALLEERIGPFKWRSYFICSYIEGISARDYFSNCEQPKKEWPMVANNISLMIDTLAEHWISHRDLNLSNIILVDHQPWLIDLDSMREHLNVLTATRGAKRERARFMRNWQHTPNLSSEVNQLFQAVFHQKM